MAINWKRFLRQVHYWASIVIAVQALVVISTGILLQLKKEIGWIQPPTQGGSSSAPSIGFERILAAAATASEAGIRTWGDVDRLDVRPAKGIVKVRGKNRWEVQVDTATAEVLQVHYRRSDLIESIHDGSFFHSRAKLWIFLPSGVILLVMWGTGIYLFILPIYARRRNRRARAAR